MKNDEKNLLGSNISSFSGSKQKSHTFFDAHKSNEYGGKNVNIDYLKLHSDNRISLNNKEEKSPRKISIEKSDSKSNFKLSSDNKNDSGFLKLSNDKAERETQDTKNKNYLYLNSGNNFKIENNLFENKFLAEERSSKSFKQLNQIKRNFGSYFSMKRQIFFEKRNFLLYSLNERNKIHFLSQILINILEIQSFTSLNSLKNDESFKIFPIFFNKYLNCFAHSIKENLVSNQNLEILRFMNKKEEFVNSFEFKKFCESFKQELDNVMNNYILFKQDFLEQKNIENLKYIENIQDFLNVDIDVITFCKITIEIVEKIIKISEVNHNERHKILNFANKILDSISVNELFDNFINAEESLDNQEYLLYISQIDSEILNEIVNLKIKYLKNKFLIL